MVKDDFAHTAIPKELLATMNRVLIDCDKLGIFLNKKQAYLIINEKAKRGKMTDIEIKEFIKRVRGVVNN